MNNEQLKILVTGGAGFIGSALIRYIIRETKHFVINIDKLSYAGNLESLRDIESSDRYTFKKIDICNASQINVVFKDTEPNIIMHLAAESHVDRSIDGPKDFITTNINGTFTLLEESRSYWLSLAKEKKKRFRFHHISTDEVYGDLKLQKEDLDENSISDYSPSLFTEETPYYPSSPYSASKAASDHLVRAWHKTYELPSIITNCSNNYGPYQFPEKLIPLIILNALNRKSLPIYGSGNQVRDWLYVEDHARALLKVALEGKIGETYNIGGHNEKRNIDVVNSICEILDELIPDGRPHSSLIEHVNDRQGHDERYAIDASKIERELDWRPAETFETGLRKTVLWYLNNTNWISSVYEKDL